MAIRRKRPASPSNQPIFGAGSTQIGSQNSALDSGTPSTQSATQSATVHQTTNRPVSQGFPQNSVNIVFNNDSEPIFGAGSTQIGSQNSALDSRTPSTQSATQSATVHQTTNRPVSQGFPQNSVNIVFNNDSEPIFGAGSTQIGSQNSALDSGTPSTGSASFGQPHPTIPSEQSAFRRVERTQRDHLKNMRNVIKRIGN